MADSHYFCLSLGTPLIVRWVVPSSSVIESILPLTHSFSVYSEIVVNFGYFVQNPMHNLNQHVSAFCVSSLKHAPISILIDTHTYFKNYSLGLRDSLVRKTLVLVDPCSILSTANNPQSTARHDSCTQS